VTDVAANTVIDGRYRILGRIGSGGMAEVYAAEDTHLGREVAIKLLHRRFARDTQFVERFRREASAAAGLQHPHVVNVFDRGEYDGTYYIAMEHLRGRVLKDVVAEDGPLPEERAIDLGLQILEAAGFAHRRGVIHRDFKPHNVIVAPDGSAKVTDFGIARSGTSEMTETGSIMGTAQYLSPEQAQGHGVTAASDLYSIGVMLYELLAGRLPFDGDSAVSVALKHLSEPPPPLSRLRPGVHPDLEAAVMRALAKDPADRYANAEQFAAALRKARQAIAAGGSRAGGTAVAGTVVPPPGEAPPDDEEERRRRWPWIALALLGLAALALAAWALTRPDKVRVPVVVGQQLAPASVTLERAGFHVKVLRRTNPAPVNQVVDQDPDGGDMAEKESEVTVVASHGPGSHTVPTVAGLPQARAVAKLSKAGFKVESESRPSSTVGTGLAIGTVPPGGTEQRVGARIRLLVSSGPRQVTVPNVVGLTRDSAVSTLDRLGLGVDVVERRSQKPKGEVIAQDPGAGARVSEGSRVTITISRGSPRPQTARVPDVVGRSEGAARAALGGAGFGVSVQHREVTDRSQDGRVIRQSPAGGAERPRGRTVAIVVGKLKKSEQKKKKDEQQGAGGGQGAPPRPGTPPA
jgi:eukaryotic-like serine/threonine-protein kinase